MCQKLNGTAQFPHVLVSKQLEHNVTELNFNEHWSKESTQTAPGSSSESDEDTSSTSSELPDRAESPTEAYDVQSGGDEAPADTQVCHPIHEQAKWPFTPPAFGFRRT